MRKVLMKSKIFPLFLVGIVITLSACNNTSDKPSNPVSESTPQELGKRSEPTPTASTDLSTPGKILPVSEATPSVVGKHTESEKSSAATDSSERVKTFSANPASTSQPSQTQPRTNSEKATSAKAQAHRENYKPIALSEIGKDKALAGDDPKAIALSAFGDVQSEGGSREVTVEYPQANQAVVTITQTGVADDSVRGIKYRAELAPTSKSASTGKQWELVWAGSQVKCQSGRGHQDWTKELCL